MPEAGTEPCYGCSCCALWQDALQLLRDHVARHVAGELRIAPCDPECLICGEIEWQGPPVLDDEARAQMRAQLLAGLEPQGLASLPGVARDRQGGKTDG